MAVKKFTQKVYRVKALVELTIDRNDYDEESGEVYDHDEFNGVEMSPDGIKAELEGIFIKVKDGAFDNWACGHIDSVVSIDPGEYETEIEFDDDDYQEDQATP